MRDRLPSRRGSHAFPPDGGSPKADTSMQSNPFDNPESRTPASLLAASLLTDGLLPGVAPGPVNKDEAHWMERTSSRYAVGR